MGFADQEDVDVDVGDGGFVDEIGPVDADEVGLEDGFPAGDGSYVPEAAAAGP